MEEKVKKILAFLLCAILSISIFVYMGLVVTPKNIKDSGGRFYYYGTGFLAEPKNSLDLIIFGNSDVYSGFTPKILYEKYGYKSYASGRIHQNVENINLLLNKSLENQEPKLVILETDCFFEKDNKQYNDFNFITPTLIYHARWKELNSKDFYEFADRTKRIDKYKGFVKSKLVYKAHYSPDYMSDKKSQSEEISKKTLKQIKKFVITCRKNNIEVLFLELPSPSSWNYQKHIIVENLAKKYSVHFLDMNIATKGYKLNAKTDFRDNGNHMNNYGAKKTTVFIGKYLKENYDNLLK